MAFENVDGREEDDGLVILDVPEEFALKRVGEVTLDLAVCDVLAFDVVW